MGSLGYLSEKYAQAERYYAATGLKMSFPVFIATLTAGAVAVAFVVSVLLKLLPAEFQSDLFLPAVSFFAVLSMAVGIPLHIRESRIDDIENNLPDALKHMAAVLRSGGTTESALEEVALSEYGALSVDLAEALRTLREGKSFDDALSDAAVKSGSPLFGRITAIVLDARKAGAGLAEVMDAIAEDSRDFIRIKRERKTRTTMHIAFLVISSLFLAPFIFGFSLAIVKFIGKGMEAAGAASTIDFANFDVLLKAFLAAQVVASALAMGVIREGKYSKNLIYLGGMMFVALLLYVAGGVLGQLMSKG